MRNEEHVTERMVRAYGNHPAEVRVERTLRLHTSVDDQAVVRAVRRLGWRVYATNHPAEALAFAQAVWAYREEYLVDRGFGRLKGKPLSLSPMYVKSDQRATGLVHLLSIGLRVLTVLELQGGSVWLTNKKAWQGCMRAIPKEDRGTKAINDSIG